MGIRYTLDKVVFNNFWCVSEDLSHGNLRIPFSPLFSYFFLTNIISSMDVSFENQ